MGIQVTGHRLGGHLMAIERPGSATSRHSPVPPAGRSEVCSTLQAVVGLQKVRVARSPLTIGAAWVATATSSASCKHLGYETDCLGPRLHVRISWHKTRILFLPHRAGLQWP